MFFRRYIYPVRPFYINRIRGMHMEPPIDRACTKSLENSLDCVGTLVRMAALRILVFCNIHTNIRDRIQFSLKLLPNCANIAQIEDYLPLQYSSLYTTQTAIKYFSRGLHFVAIIYKYSSVHYNTQAADVKKVLECTDTKITNSFLLLISRLIIQ